MSLILELIFPRYCYGCGREGQYFCTSCRQMLKTGSLIVNPKSAFAGRVCLFKYHSFLKSALKDLKYNFVTDLVPELACFCGDIFRSDYPHLIHYWHQNHFFLVPVPLNTLRRNWRGFNQSSLVGQLLAENLGLQYCDILLRPLNTSSQVTLKSKSRRLKNIAGAFKLDQQYLGKIPSNIILFDDVCTTSATLNAAARVLKPETTGELWALTIAA